MSYVSTLINVFGVGHSDAWSMTVKEFWALYQQKYPDAEKKLEESRPVSKKDFEEMVLRLRQKGKDV